MLVFMFKLARFYGDSNVCPLAWAGTFLDAVPNADFILAFVFKWILLVKNNPHVYI